MGGAFLSFYAFIGFEDMVNVAEEVKNPRRTLPLAIFLALMVCATLYAAIALVAVLQVEPSILGKQEVPLAYLYQTVTGRPPVLIGILSLFAIVNGVLIQIIMVSRILYGMAWKKWLPACLSTVHPRFRTPVKATALMIVIILILAILFPLVALAAFTSLVVLITFTLVNAALLKIKLSPEDETAEGIRVPVLIPALGIVCSLSLAAVSIFL